MFLHKCLIVKELLEEFKLKLNTKLPSPIKDKIVLEKTKILKKLCNNNNMQFKVNCI
jgi:hypothetical protein